MTLEEAKELLDEEYAKAKRFGFIHNKIAYALYQVWKKADKERGKNKKTDNEDEVTGRSFKKEDENGLT